MTGPDTTFHQSFTIQGGRATGSGRLAEGGNLDTGMYDTLTWSTKECPYVAASATR